MYDNTEPFKCDPPGTFREIVAHPGGHNRVIEKAIMMEHRFAFVFWMKWKQALQQRGWLRQPAPTLVTIDWHRDLAPPGDHQKRGLEKLDLSNLSDTANYVWAQFDQTNDGHILCAAWLNLIGDIVLLKNSAGPLRDTFTDREDNSHRIFEFREYERFEEFLTGRDDHNVFLDIDLDYFIHGKGNVFYPGTFEPYSETEIKAVIDYQSPVFDYLLPRLEGLTIAQEPSYCGGITNSCSILKVVNSQLFDGQNNWKHLKNS
ncbi:UPF0489 domain-containing protein [Fodinibius roseus]|uniref:UPF0489 domain-containing protein n=1 Tax=Fodinibius roseus TaxID=1194090 RepID=A0A1M5FLT9_9BACT|nr:UPF0489 family protein [Fodinibius roseus]SHF92547.1 UPF0489 domain-containing protein [Fodinibius roseus]